jgi:N-acetylglucosamine-6-phosphate deacetylase
MTLHRFRNCKLIRHHALLIDDLWIRNGKIINPQEIFFDEKIQADIEYDCQGVLIAPGYIDLQINGAFGHDFSSADEASEEMLRKVARQLTSHGVTAFAPTVVSSDAETYKTILPKYKRRAGSAKDGATILGIHIEGPFIDENKRGAHRTDFLRKSPHGIEDLLSCYGSFENVCIITVAPEIPNMIEKVIPQLIEKYHLIVSIGHSVASLDQGERAVCAGARFITHLFNAMLPFHHRDPGLVGLLTSHRVPTTTDIYYGLIVDGIHTHSAAVRLAHRVHSEGLVLVTDAVPAFGLPDGTYHMGANKIVVKDKRATIAGTETLCGSIASLAECVQNMRQALLDGETKTTGEIDKNKFIVESIEAATLHPALVLGIEKQKGTLSFGADADFILLDAQLNVLSTFIAGEQAWTISEQWSIDNLRKN